MKYGFIVLLLLTPLTNTLFAQQNNTILFQSTPSSFSSSMIEDVFASAKMITIPSNRIKALLKSKQSNHISLDLDGLLWELDIESAEICPEGTPQRINNIISKTAYDPTFKGTTQEGKSFRLTINDDFIAGVLPLGEKEYFIEPTANFDTRAPKNTFVLYEKGKIKPKAPRKCIVDDVEEKQATYTPNLVERVAPCVETELAVATDPSMFVRYGSTTNIENRVNSIMNLVAGVYESSFAYRVKFKIVTWYHAQNVSPWTTSNSAGDILDSFSDWGAAGGFGANYDLGQFWTNKDFSGSTIGIAWLSGVCAGDLRHHAIQNFSDNDALMRCVVAHEIGHNFSMTHNSEIMASSVSEASTWSGSSIAQINNYLPKVIGSTCLALCSSGSTASQAPIADFTFTPEDTVCINRQVQFEDISKNTPNNYKWSFEGGTPSASSLPNPKVLYKIPGTYTITLTVTNSIGTNSITKKINVATVPTPTFTHKVEGLNVVFTNTTPGYSAWFWKFGDNKTATEKNPTHLYANHGNFAVILTATNSCGMRNFSKTIPVVPIAPTAAFRADTLSGCAPLTIKFTNLSANAQSFSWRFEGGKTLSLNAKEPTVLYENAGQYDVQLIAHNSNLVDTILLKKAVKVNATPKAIFACKVIDNGLVQFVNKSTGADSLRWDFGDSKISLDTMPSHFYKKSGRYIARLSAKNNCGISIALDTIDILLAPIADFEVDSSYTNCKKVSFTLKNMASEDATSFSWKTPFATTDTSSLENLTVSYSKSGIYEIKLIVKNAAGIDSLLKKVVVTIKEDPIAFFQDSISERNIYFQNQSKFTSNYDWDFGDSQKSKEKTPSHAYAKDGNYTIRLTVYNDCDTSFFSKNIRIVTKPKADFKQQVAAGCAPVLVNFQEKSSENTANVVWYFEGGTPSTSTESNPKITYEKAGKYAVTLVVKNTAGADSLYKKDLIVVQSLPFARFIPTVKSNEVEFQNTTTNALNYTWDFGDSTTSQEVNPKHLYKKTGKYNVRLLAENECSKTEFTEFITLNFTKNQEFLTEKEITVFPNPSTGFFTLSLNTNTNEPVDFQLYNSIGQAVALENRTTHDVSNSYHFDLNYLPKGIYFLAAKGKISAKRIKIVLE
jgi:PKD repeat protein